MKYAKYRITKEMNKYYIEVPFLFFFWRRLSYCKLIDLGPAGGMTIKEHYEFKRYGDANDFADTHKYIKFMEVGG